MVVPGRSAPHLTVMNSIPDVHGGILNAETLEPLTLLGAKVEIAVEHFIARVRITQEAGHASSRPLRTLFSFPVREEWTVVGWSVASKAVEASAMSRDRQSKFATFREGAFVAPIPGDVHPGDTVVCTLTFLTSTVPVAGSDTSLEVLVSKHVLPEERQPRTEWQDHFRVSMQQKLPRSISIAARVLGFNKVEGVSLPSHPSSATQQSRVDYHAELSYSKPYGEMSQHVLENDVRLRIDIRADPQQLMKLEIVAPKDEEVLPEEDFHVLAVTIHPTKQTIAAVAEGSQDADLPNLNAPNTDVVIMVDCSGSMAPVMEHVKAAALLAVQGIPACCMFNVVAFGCGAPDGVKAVFEESAAYDDESLDAAAAFIDGLQADLGGTSLYPALRFAYTRKIRRGYCRQVFLVTDAVGPADGDVRLGSRRDCVQLARDNKGNTRLWCFGMKPLCDEALLGPLAEQSGGAFRHVDQPQDLRGQLLSALEEALTPCLTNVELTYSLESQQEEGDHSGTLAHIRPCFGSIPLLFVDRRHTVLSLAHRKLAPDTAVTLSGLIGDQEVTLTDHVQELTAENKKLRYTEGAPQDFLTHAAAARDRIRTLTEPEWEWKQWLAGGDERCLFAGPTAPGPDAEAEIRRLAFTFNMATPLTSLRVATGGLPSDSSPEIALEYHRQVPEDARRQRLLCRATPQRRQRQLRLTADGQAIDADYIPPTPPQQPPSTREFVASVVHDIVASITDPGWPSLPQVLRLQRADGRWEATEVLAQSVGSNLRNVLKAMPALKVDADESVDWQAVWATALAHEYLPRRFPSQEPEWKLMRRRATRFLEGMDCALWLSNASNFLSALTAS